MSTQAAPATQQPGTQQQGIEAPQQDWRASLPEDLRAEKSFEKFAGVGDVAKSYLELQKSMGNAIRIPKADAPQEERDKFFSRLGRPETPDKYEFKVPELPEAIKIDDKFLARAKQSFHRAGLNPMQAQMVLDDYTAIQSETYKEIAPSLEESQGTLKSTWGDKYDSNIGLALETAKESGGESYQKWLSKTGVGNAPEEVKAWAKAGEIIAGLRAQLKAAGAEDTLIVGDSTAQAGNAESIQQEIDSIMKTPEYWGKNGVTPKAKMALNDKVVELRARLSIAKGEPQE